MYKAFDFKGTLDEQAMREISKFWGKNVELIVRELPPADQATKDEGGKEAGITADEWLRRLFDNFTGSGGLS